MDFQAAVEAFARGMAYERGLTHPVETIEVGPILLSRDSPPRKRDPRLDHFTIGDVDPAAAIDVVRDYNPTRWALCVISPAGSDPAMIKAAYKGAGYKQITHLPVYSYDLANLRPMPTQVQVARVTTVNQADAIAKVAGRRQIRPGQLVGGDSPMRLYAAFSREQAIGYVRSTVATERARWVSNLFVVESERRKGIGAAVMNAMLTDDLRYGYQLSVLTATREGSILYERLGYENVGLLQVFAPIKKSKIS
jgi:GNAT superfamily N-acetyltransferase